MTQSKEVTMAINKRLHQALLNGYVVVYAKTESQGKGNATECHYNGSTFSMQFAGQQVQPISGAATTIGELRQQWADEWAATNMPDNMPCVVYEFPSHGATLVAVKLSDLQAELARLAHKAETGMDGQ